MTIDEFAQLAPGLSGAFHVEKIKHFAWYVLTQENQERFDLTDIRRCYGALHFALPTNLSNQLQQLADKKPPELLRDSGGYRLEGRVKQQLDSKYGQRPTTIAVHEMLQSLPGKVSDEAERVYLTEALTCYRHKAFRAAIVMTWNLAYDHLLNWIMATQLPAFNAAISRRFQKKAAVTVTNKEDFGDEFKEWEVIEICGTAAIISDSVKKILSEKLTKRNMAAHPSLVTILQYQTDDVVSDLVNNVILKLA